MVTGEAVCRITLNERTSPNFMSILMTTAQVGEVGTKYRMVELAWWRFIFYFKTHLVIILVNKNKRERVCYAWPGSRETLSIFSLGDGVGAQPRPQV